MSCPVCAGYSSHKCPCCGGGRKMRECPDCEDGMEYYSFNVETRQFVRVTALAYYILPDDEDAAYDKGERYCKGETVPCKTCHGEREVA